MRAGCRSQVVQCVRLSGLRSERRATARRGRRHSVREVQAMRSLRVLVFAVSVAGFSVAPARTRATADGPIIYSEDHTAASTIQDRDPGDRPAYLIYADGQ